MSITIRTNIIKIGNAQGIRIPKTLLDQVESGILLEEEVELEVEANQIVIRKIKTTRAGWDGKFQKMAELGDDQLLDNVILGSNWDNSEWEWS